MHRPWLARLLLVPLLACCAVARAAEPATDAGDSLAALTPAEAAVAERALAFLAHIEQSYWAHVRALNGAAELESKSIDVDTAHYDVRVARGKVIEKAGVLAAITRTEIRPYFLGGRWNRFLEFDVHPATPLVGMLHATLVVQFGSDGSGNVGGWIDELPAKRVPEDLDYLRRRADEVFAKYGVDAQPYRVRGCDGDPNEIKRKWRRLPACAGASLYGPPALAANERNLEFVSSMFETVLDGYFATVERRRNSRYTPEDVRLQDAMRRRWLEDQLFSDPLSSKMVPYEVWSFASVPPVVRY